MDGPSQSGKYRIHTRYVLRDAQTMLQTHQKAESSATLFSRGHRTRTFFTQDSQRYITQSERQAMLSGVRRFERSGHMDSVLTRYTRPVHSQSEVLYRDLQARYSSIRETFRYFPDMLSAHISPLRVWNASIVGAIFFGMFSMTLIYRYLGQSAAAEGTNQIVINASVIESSSVPSTPAVLGEATQAPPSGVSITSSPTPVIDPLDAIKAIDRNRFNAEVTDMVKGYPIEAMLPYILKQDRDVAMFLIAIGKKESNWGKRVPVLNGQDCYNYWGYRGIRDKMGTGGHTCFNNPEDAVTTVAKRIKTLVQEKKLNTPAKMIVWKCGSTCTGHSGESVRKWISDVDMYVQELK